MPSLKQFVIAAVLAAAFLAPTTHAATASSFLDLSELSFSTYGNLTHSFSASDWHSAYVSANAVGDHDYRLGAVSIGVASGGAFARSSASASKLASEANAPVSNSSSNANWYGTLSLSGTGVIVITVPYALSVSSILGSDNAAYASASLNLGHYQSDGGVSDSLYASVSKSLSSSNFMFQSGGRKDASGSLALAYYFTGASTNFSLSAFTNSSASSNLAAVPEPASYAMLLAGLGLLGAFARRRVQA